MKGLIGAKALTAGQALVITRCQSIHMFGMSFSIDVIFCDRQNKVVGRCVGIKPFRLSPVFFRAHYAIELPTGSIAASGTALGDHLSLTQEKGML